MARREWRRWALILLWAGLGAFTIAGFFLVGYFQDYSPVRLGDPGVVILFAPLLIGFLLGILLTDEEIVVAAGAGVLTAILALLLISVFLVAPVLAGILPADRAFAEFSVPQIMLSTVILFPVIVVGSVIGRGVGDLYLPSPRLREQLEALREETRRWHDMLDRIEVRPREPAAGPPEEPEKKA